MMPSVTDRSKIARLVAAQAALQEGADELNAANEDELFQQASATLRAVVVRLNALRDNDR